MPKYAGQLQINSTIRLKDFVSLQELPRIFANVTKAIGIFVDIWLGKDVDPTCLYNPKPTSNSIVTMNDNTSSSRPFTQSVRGNPPVLQPTGTLKSTKSQVENRRSNLK
jgi:hypothetical protein